MIIIIIMIIIIMMAGLRPIAAEFLAAPPPSVWPVGGVVVAVTAVLVFIHIIIVFRGFSLFFDVF